MSAARSSIDVAGLAAHAHAVRLATRTRPDPPAVAPEVEVSAEAATWFRIRASGAAVRLPAGELAAAASGGLQDSAPRAAQVALHARVEGVDPDAWQHAALAQVWLRWAAYVVPRRDVHVFTCGALPRDARRARALAQLADAVAEIIGEDGPRDSKAVRNALLTEVNDSLLRAACLTGRVVIRWDARTTSLVRHDPPDVDIDIEAARLELARRFLRWMAPASPHHFAKWAGVSLDDAAETWAALRGEIAEVAVGGGQRWVLAADVVALAKAERPAGVRMLPPGDPCLFMDRVAEPAPHAVGGTITSRLVNSLTGRILMDGALVGAWGRTQGHVTLDPWPVLPQLRRSQVEAAADSLSAPIGQPISVRWLPRRDE